MALRLLEYDNVDNDRGQGSACRLISLGAILFYDRPRTCRRNKVRLMIGIVMVVSVGLQFKSCKKARVASRSDFVYRQIFDYFDEKWSHSIGI